MPLEVRPLPQVPVLVASISLRIGKESYSIDLTEAVPFDQACDRAQQMLDLLRARHKGEE